MASYGVAGLASYGVANTIYYSVAFAFVWTQVLRVPPGLGLAAAGRRAAEAFALVWLGSQATKLARVGAALALAPLAAAQLERLRVALRLGTQAQAFAVLVAACLSTAAAVAGWCVWSVA